MLFGKDGTAEANPRPTDKAFPAPPPSANREPMAAMPAASSAAASTAPKVALKESVLSSELTIEGKIEGAGHVRIAGKFKGDVHVQGNVTIEQGAVVTGEVKADVVIIAGQLDGNVDATTRVELLSSGLLNGDLKAGSLTVAAGSRMRGRAEFGWNDKAK
jgi:cytoskeletal protein CcmA (bactofilin family)